MKVLKVIQIETFDDQQFLIRLDKPWEDEFIRLFTKLLAEKRIGSVAHVSLGTVDAKVYLDIPDVGAKINSLNIKKGNDDV